MPPARHSPTTLSETFAKVRFLKELGADSWALDAVPIEKQRAYAQRVRARRPAKVRELKASARRIELIFFLRVALLELPTRYSTRPDAGSPISYARRMIAPLSDRHARQ